MGCLAQVSGMPCGEGGSALESGWSDHHEASARRLSLRINPFGHTAPSATQRPINATCSLLSGGLSLGISGLSPEMYWINRLSSGLPGLTAAPLSPPARVDSAATSESFPFGWLGPWQEIQFWINSGAT